MARFYQSSQPGFIDNKMFELPWQLMANNIKTKDKDIEDTIASVTALQDKLKAQGLQQDQPRLKEILTGYENQVNDIVGGIQANPIDYNKYSSQMRKLSRSINNDWTIGEVAAIQGNKAAYLDSVKTYEELAKKNPDQYGQDYLDALTKGSLKKYKGASYNPATGQYQTYNAMDALGFGNLADDLNKNVGEHLKADGGDYQVDKVTGQWTKKVGNKWEAVSPEKLKQAAQDYLKASPEKLNALKQRGELALPGYENPVNYLENAINSFVSTNAYKKTAHSEDLQANPYAMADYTKKLAQDDDDIVSRTVTDFVTSPAGATPTDYVNKRNGIMSTIDNTKQEAYTMVLGEKGYKSDKELMLKEPLLYDAIRKGDFSGVTHLPQGKRLKNQYDQAKLELAGQEALKSEFVKKYRQQPSADNKNWQDFLKTTSKTQVNQSMTWDGITLNGKQVTNKQIEQTAQTLVEGNHVSSAKIRFPDGFTVKGKNLGNQEMSINDMIAQGLVEAEPVKVPTITKTGEERKDSNGKVILPAKYELQYKLTDGTGTIGFSVSSQSLAPVQGLNDEGNMEMGGIFNVRGKQVVGRFDDVSTSSIKQFDAANSKRMKTRLMLQKYSTAEAVELPKSGVIYHGKDVFEKGKKIHSRGTVEVPIGNGKYKTYNANDPEVENVISTLMYGQD